MNLVEWANSLTEEQRLAFAEMDDNQAMEYLASEGIELPDEVLEGIAGGLPLGKLVGNWLKGKLGSLLH